MPEIRTLEECCLNAWPALQELVFEGWLLRFGRGFTRRANSVHAVYGSESGGVSGGVSGGLKGKVDRCEGIYAARGLACVFKITPLAQPECLDDLLSGRGYRREGETSVQLLGRLPDAPPPAADCALSAADSSGWLEVFTAYDATPPRHHSTLRAILQRIPLPHTGALLHTEGQAVSCGRAVAEHDLVGLFDIATGPECRRKGHAGTLIAHLLAWGRAQGARRAYLQVEADNAPALHLYRKLGFREVYRYWYRVK